MHMVTSNHVYADELTVHGEHDVKTWIQQDWKRESCAGMYIYQDTHDYVHRQCYIWLTYNEV